MASEGSERQNGNETNHVVRCPYCLTPMEGVAIQPKLTSRNFAIYKTIVEAGPGGVPVDKVIERCLKGDKKAGTIRSAVCYINKKISPMRLFSRGGRYYLENYHTNMGK